MTILYMAKYQDGKPWQLCRVKSQKRIVAIMQARGYEEINREVWEELLKAKREKLNAETKT